MKGYIVENSAVCGHCGVKVVSKHRHDFVRCECGKLAVDGGQDYLKRTGNIDDSTETSIIMDEEVIKDCIKAVDWAKETGRNSTGIALAVIRTLRDSDNLKLD